ncbi:MAG: agmatinase [Proteobacteria bacterium]|nr:agmatinase [Desulfobacteraceae bacterium]MBU3980599.1 agmatinase [Pseudomonadota bacterium]MBU4013152.1 agmatinase [Pseudomonadota bacterium]MBU4067503.1 agmatinase [Pseudomonadota bacterium]MBU4100196.1 agmatinase [Pseudomonadota bacterium]
MEFSIYPGLYGCIPEEFCRYKEASIAILPIPYDGTSTWMKGSNLGPQALLDASANMELYDIETDSEVFKRGIVTIDPVSCPDDPEAMVDVVCDRARSILNDGKFIVGIGGEHTISIGSVRAAAERFSDLSVLQFDAHSDTRNEYEGSRYNHACVMSRIAEICPYVQAGIRSMDSSELERLNRDRTFFAHEILNGSNVTNKILKALTHNVYITIDLDVFDPSIMPSTGTPEPGGLDWYSLIKLIKLVVREKDVVGMDVTELLPNPANRSPDFMAAKLVYRVLSMIFTKKKES